MLTPPRPEAAWCSHCELTEPMPLLDAITHRELLHHDCFSCRLENLLFQALTLDDPPDDAPWVM
jgi:hypothetical protein